MRWVPAFGNDVQNTRGAPPFAMRHRSFDGVSPKRSNVHHWRSTQAAPPTAPSSHRLLYPLASMSDYRESHLKREEAAWYDAQMYAPGTYDSWKWDLEQDWIADVIRRRLGNRAVRHLDFACGTGRVLA